VRVFNIDEKRLSAFELKSSSMGIEAGSIIDLAFNPAFKEELVLLFASHGIVVWSFKSNKPLLKKDPEFDPSCCCWCPDGQILSVGTKDSSVVLLKGHKSLSPYKVLRLSTLNSSQTLILKLFWQDSTLLAFSSLPTHSSTQLTSFSGSDLSAVHSIQIPENTVLKQVIPAKDASSTFIALSESSSLFLFTPSSAIIHAFNELYSGPSTTCSYYSDLSPSSSHFSSIFSLSSTFSQQLLSGGDVADVPFGLLITGHLGGIVRLWSVFPSSVTNVLNLCLTAQASLLYPSQSVFEELSDSAACRVTCVALFPAFLAVAFDQGKVALWQLSARSASLAVVYHFHTAPVFTLHCSADFVVSSDLEGTLVLYNTLTNSAIVEDVKTTATTKQMLVVTCLSCARDMLLVGLNNGEVKAYNLGANTFVNCAKMQRVDLKNEVPDSEVAVLGIFRVEDDGERLVVAYENGMVVCKMGSFEVQASQAWNRPMVAVRLGKIGIEVYVFLVHSDAVLSVLSYPGLKRVWKKQITVEPGYCLSRICINNFWLADNGRFFVTTNSSTVISGTIDLQQNIKSQPKPRLFVPILVPKTEKKRKSFLGISYSSEVNYEELCNI
jgi:hypothetical protein